MKAGSIYKMPFTMHFLTVKIGISCDAQVKQLQGVGSAFKFTPGHRNVPLECSLHSIPTILAALECMLIIGNTSHKKKGSGIVCTVNATPLIVGKQSFVSSEV